MTLAFARPCRAAGCTAAALESELSPSLINELCAGSEVLKVNLQNTWSAINEMLVKEEVNIVSVDHDTPEVHDHLYLVLDEHKEPSRLSAQQTGGIPFIKECFDCRASGAGREPAEEVVCSTHPALGGCSL